MNKEHTCVVETKQLGIDLKGKNGDVQSTTIQRHNPYQDMVLIFTESGNFIFCQKDHPLFIFDPLCSEIVEKEAQDVNQDLDMIWTDNSIIFNENAIIPKHTPEEVFEALSITLLDENDHELIYKAMNECEGTLLGDSIRNVRLSPDFINYDKNWIKKFIDLIIEYNDVSTEQIFIPSYNFFQQLKLMCDRINYSFNFISVLHINSICWFCVTIRNENIKTKKINKFETIDMVYTVGDYNYDVFDIKTNTQEFMLGCIQNHNSFHTGGAVELKLANYYNELSANLEDDKKDFIMQACTQDGNDLITNASFTSIRIDKLLFKDKDKYKIQITPDFIELPLGYFDITFESLSISSTMEFPVKIYKKDADIEETDKYILLTFAKGKKILNSPPRSTEAAKTANKIDELLGGKSPWTSPENLFMKLFSTLKDFDNWDVVHLETVLANVLRAKKDPQFAARLKEPYEPIMFSVKTLPGIISWPTGLAFEDFSKSISRAMISDRGPESSIEKVLFGDVLSDLELAEEERKKRKNREEKNKK